MILFEGRDQIREELLRQAVFPRRVFQRDKDGMMNPANSHRVQFAPPPGQQPQAFGGVADFVAQIVRPAAERIDVVEILVKPLGQQEGDDVKILVMAGCQPARVRFGLGLVYFRSRASADATKLLGCGASN